MANRDRHVWLYLLSMAAAFVVCRSSPACLWDYDTIRDERRGMPGIAEIIAGRYEKHSRFFYEERVARMNALLKIEPKNLDAWDNLAVAYEKLNDHAKAIEIILKKDAIAPGQYTTYANLGTFYLRSGNFDDGITAIRRALEINPDAHFGREEYQLQLAIYLRDAKKNPELLTQMNFLEYAGILPPIATTAPTTRSVENRSRLSWSQGPMMRSSVRRDSLAEMGVKANVFDGISGIIRFGNGDSPELFLVLGDLLTARGNKNLAYRAYKRALDLHHPRTEYVQDMMREISSVLIHGANDNAIAKERADAAAWVQGYQTFEDDLIRRGADTENLKNYEVFYSTHGSPIPVLTWRESIDNWFDHNGLELQVSAIGVIALAMVVMAIRWRRRRRARRIRIITA